jgi:hypothetical protein
MLFCVGNGVKTVFYGKKQCILQIGMDLISANPGLRSEIEEE